VNGAKAPKSGPFQAASGCEKGSVGRAATLIPDPEQPPQPPGMGEPARPTPSPSDRRLAPAIRFQAFTITP